MRLQRVTANERGKTMNKEFLESPSDRYYSTGVTGGSGNCAHDTFTVSSRSLGKQVSLAKTCDSCGERRSYLMYAKYCKR